MIDVEKSIFKQLNDVEFKEEYLVKISNTFFSFR
jgi:hypothetical protein